MSCQLTTHTHIPFTSFQVVNGANVVQATTGHVVPRRGVSTGHDPGRAQRDGVDLNGRNTDKTNARKLKNTDNQQVWWCTPANSATQEVEVG